MAGNGHGTYRTSRHASMANYDAAPPFLRFAMRNAVGKWAAAPLVEDWNAGIPPQKIIATIVRGDREDTIKFYGPTHPEAMQ